LHCYGQLPPILSREVRASDGTKREHTMSKSEYDFDTHRAPPRVLVSYRIQPVIQGLSIDGCAETIQPFQRLSSLRS
jgi:hypothetical protein